MWPATEIEQLIDLKFDNSNPNILKVLILALSYHPHN